MSRVFERGKRMRKKTGRRETRKGGKKKLRIKEVSCGLREGRARGGGERFLE